MKRHLYALLLPVTIALTACQFETTNEYYSPNRDVAARSVFCHVRHTLLLQADMAFLLRQFQGRSDGQGWPSDSPIGEWALPNMRVERLTDTRQQPNYRLTTYGDQHPFYTLSIRDAETTRWQVEARAAVAGDSLTYRFSVDVAQADSWLLGPTEVGPKPQNVSVGEAGNDTLYGYDAFRAHIDAVQMEWGTTEQGRHYCLFKARGSMQSAQSPALYIDFTTPAPLLALQDNSARSGSDGRSPFYHLDYDGYYMLPLSGKFNMKAHLSGGPQEDIVADIVLPNLTQVHFKGDTEIYSW